MSLLTCSESASVFLWQEFVHLFRNIFENCTFVRATCQIDYSIWKLRIKSVFRTVISLLPCWKVGTFINKETLYFNKFRLCLSQTVLQCTDRGQYSAGSHINFTVSASVWLEHVKGDIIAKIEFHSLHFGRKKQTLIQQYTNRGNCISSAIWLFRRCLRPTQPDAQNTQSVKVTPWAVEYLFILTHWVNTLLVYRLDNDLLFERSLKGAQLIVADINVACRFWNFLSIRDYVT